MTLSVLFLDETPRKILARDYFYEFVHPKPALYATPAHQTLAGKLTPFI